MWHCNRPPPCVDSISPLKHYTLGYWVSSTMLPVSYDKCRDQTCSTYNGLGIGKRHVLHAFSSSLHWGAPPRTYPPSTVSNVAPFEGADFIGRKRALLYRPVKKCSASHCRAGISIAELNNLLFTGRSWSPVFQKAVGTYEQRSYLQYNRMLLPRAPFVLK